MNMPIKLTNILNEMAMKPTLEKEFEEIVRGLQGEYEKDIAQRIRASIERAKPVVDAANKEAIKKRSTHYLYGKLFGTDAPFSDRKFGFSHFFKRWVFLHKESAARYDSKFKKEIQTAYDKWDSARAKDADNADDLWWAWKMELAQYVMMRESYWKAALDKEAKHASEMFYTSFIKKNVAKFSNIIKGKDIVEISHSLTPTNLSGYLIVKCSDGSRFRASFSVEMSISKNGKWFNRFPTRFHNVILSDGTKMKSPSEAKMKREF